MRFSSAHPEWVKLLRVFLFYRAVTCASSVLVPLFGMRRRYPMPISATIRLNVPGYPPSVRSGACHASPPEILAVRTQSIYMPTTPIDFRSDATLRVAFHHRRQFHSDNIPSSGHFANANWQVGITPFASFVSAGRVPSWPIKNFPCTRVGKTRWPVVELPGTFMP
jgi:hypothetical protein